MLGDWARAQKARRHKRPEAFTFHTDQASWLPIASPIPTCGLSCWQAPWGTYRASLPSLVLAGSQPPCTDSAPGREEACSSWQPHGRTASSRIKQLPPRGPEGVLRAGAHTALESELGVVLNICQWFDWHLTTDPAASISKMWGS